MNRELAYDDVFDAQGHFRLLLDSMARPGKINKFPDLQIACPDGFQRGIVLVAFALLNADAGFHILSGQKDEVTQYLRLNTSSNSQEISVADFIFMSGYARTDEIAKIKTGTLFYPEEGATLVIDVEMLSDAWMEHAMALTLSGPGVNGRRDLFIKGIGKSLLIEIGDRNAEFPLGVDVIFCDSLGQIAAMPRSCRVYFD